jgi:hypothetical protein
MARNQASKSNAPAVEASEPRNQSQTGKATAEASRIAEAAAKAADQLQQKWKKDAEHAVTVLLSGREEMQRIGATQRDEYLGVARKLKDPKASLDEKGFHANSRAFMVAFVNALRERTKKDDTINSRYADKLASNLRQVIVAAQVGDGVTLENFVLNPETKAREDIKVKNAIDFMEEWSTDLNTLRNVASLIRRQTEYRDKRGSNAGKSTTIAPATLQGIMDNRLHAKLGPQGIVTMLDFLRREIKSVGGIPSTMRKELTSEISELVDKIKDVIAKPETDADAESKVKHAKAQADGTVRPFQRKAA